jgi:hypothetical protein
MTDSRHRSLLARIRDRLNTLAPVAEPEINTEPEPPRVVHEFGSQYRVRVPFDETMAARGYSGTAAQYRCRIPERGDSTSRQRDTALERAGFVPGEVL